MLAARTPKGLLVSGQMWLFGVEREGVLGWEGVGPMVTLVVDS